MRLSGLAVLVVFLGAAVPAAADEARPEDLATIEKCVAAAEPGGGAACIGWVSEACRGETTDGETTLGIVACAARETSAWDRILNEEYRATRAFAQGADAAEAAHFPDFATMADALLMAQRAWIEFRDAECGLAYALWGSGSMRTIAAENCRMVMTAERALDLRAMRGEGM